MSTRKVLERIAIALAIAGVIASAIALVVSPSSSKERTPAPVKGEAFEALTRVSGTGDLVGYVRGPSALLRRDPGGPVIRRVGRLGNFKSVRVFAVTGSADEQNWFRVIAPELGNNVTAWVSRAELRLSRVQYSLDVDVSERRVTVRRGRRAVLSFKTAVGRAGTETPRGLFSLTDKLQIQDNTPYGCCAVALSARQPNIPQGWGGGDRIALHATNRPETIGTAASLGCLRAEAEHVRRVMQLVPLGARVRIHA